MRRRTVIAGLALGALAMARASRAQPARKVHRIGILIIGAASDFLGPEPRNPQVNAFLRRLGELGYVYGQHFVTEPRGSEGKPERFPSLAAELVRLQVDVIVAPEPALPALKQTTSTVPVIMAAATDPVGQGGYVRSLGHPGGNFTGLSLQSVEATGKRLELLKELVPGTTPVAVLWNPPHMLDWRVAEAAGRERGWKMRSVEIRDAGEIEGAFKAATDAGAGSLLVFAAGILYPHRRQVAQLAIKSRIPAMYELRPYVEAGGLISYSADLTDVWRRAAVFVDKILRGARPADLPVEQPTKFELVINLGAAKSIGLTVPQALLLRADEMIQ